MYFYVLNFRNSFLIAKAQKQLFLFNFFAMFYVHKRILDPPLVISPPLCIFALKMMVKSSLEFVILKLNKPL